VAANKYLANSSGQITEVQASDSSAGAGDGGKIVALDSTGRIDPTMMPSGIGAPTVALTASEALAAGDFVNIHVSTGNKVRKADASNGRLAHGFVLSSVSNGGSATVYLDGQNTAVTGLTAGTKYFLSGSTAGLPTDTAPTTSGYYVQELGTAYDAAGLNFQPKASVLLA
jgi:hypothetical protein